MMMANTFFLGGFCLIVPLIILVVLILTLRDKNDNSLAILSLITGILGFFILPIVGSIAAIVSGNLALAQYKLSPEINGSTNASLARAGVILGWIGLGIWILGVVGFLLFLLPVSATTTILP